MRRPNGAGASRSRRPASDARRAATAVQALVALPDGIFDAVVIVEPLAWSEIPDASTSASMFALSSFTTIRFWPNLLNVDFRRERFNWARWVI